MACCCADAANGHDDTALPNSLINSRRFMASPALDHFQTMVGTFRRRSKCGQMSALGYLLTFHAAPAMSALILEADTRVRTGWFLAASRNNCVIANDCHLLHLLPDTRH